MAMDAPFPRGGLEEQVLLERTPSGGNEAGYQFRGR
jgi:hypothetical protein